METTIFTIQDTHKFIVHTNTHTLGGLRIKGAVKNVNSHQRDNQTSHNEMQNLMIPSQIFEVLSFLEL